MIGMEFQYPQVLWLLLLLLPLAYHSWNSRNERKASLQFSVAQPFLRQRSWRSYLAEYLPLLRIPVIALLLIALARPREQQMDVKRRSSEGIDIVLAIDVSASMLAKDLLDGKGFGFVAEWSTRAMGIDVANSIRLTAGILKRQRHRLGRSPALFIGLRDVPRVTS